MAKPAELEKLTGVASRFGAFVAERHPFALTDAIDAWEAVTGGREPKRRSGDRGAAAGASPRAREAAGVARRCRRGSARRRRARPPPGASSRRRARCVDECDGFLRRAGDRSVADARRAPRDPARHDPDARHRQPSEGVLPRRRSPLRRQRVPGQGISVARAGSDLRRRDASAARSGISTTERERSGHRPGGRRWQATSSVR